MSQPPSMSAKSDPSCRVVSVHVNVSNYTDATERLTTWAKHREHRYVCVAPVHPIMEAFDKPDYRAIINGADFVTADGMPVVWAQKLFGHKQATRVYGPTLTLHLCEKCADEGLSIGLYGGSEAALARMQESLLQRYPNLNIAYAFSPPFRKLATDEDEAIVADILKSKCQLLFIGLGTPKQDLWMSAHRDQLPLVQIGVGAAFDFISGAKKQAPSWMQNNGLEWLYRLCSEPRRLWFRYFWHNPRYVGLVFWQLISGQRSRHSAQATEA